MKTLPHWPYAASSTPPTEGWRSSAISLAGRIP